MDFFRRYVELVLSAYYLIGVLSAVVCSIVSNRYGLSEKLYILLGVHDKLWRKRLTYVIIMLLAFSGLQLIRAYAESYVNTLFFEIGEGVFIGFFAGFFSYGGGFQARVKEVQE